MHRTEVDGKDSDTTANHVDALPVCPPHTGRTVIPFPAVLPLKAGIMVGGFTSEPSTDYFEKLGTSVLAVVLRLGRQFPRVNVLKSED